MPDFVIVHHTNKLLIIYFMNAYIYKWIHGNNWFSIYKRNSCWLDFDLSQHLHYTLIHTCAELNAVLKCWLFPYNQHKLPSKFHLLIRAESAAFNTWNSTTTQFRTISIRLDAKNNLSPIHTQLQCCWGIHSERIQLIEIHNINYYSLIQLNGKWTHSKCLIVR